MIVERQIVRTVHEITLRERLPNPIIATLRAIAPAAFTLITSTVEKTASLFQSHTVLEGCAVVVATGVFNYIVDDAVVGQVDHREV